LVNHYDPSSEVGRLNAEGELLCASADTLAIIRKALEVSALSDGAFDISVMPLVDLYGDCAGAGKPPPENDIGAARALVDYRNIEIDGAHIRFLRPDMRVSLAGIAKGYIVDRAIAVLEECGVTRAMVDGGGDIRVLSEPGERPWVIGVRDPLARKRALCLLAANRLSIASSGPYAHRYNDIIDPRSGIPVKDVIGASVVCPEAATADALATCLSMWKPDEGIAFAERIDGAEALLVSAAGVQYKTSGWSAYERQSA
jgi:thiamine biosynthesis lipoprotein